MLLRKAYSLTIVCAVIGLMPFIFYLQEFGVAPRSHVKLNLEVRAQSNDNSVYLLAISVASNKSHNKLNDTVPEVETKTDVNFIPSNIDNLQHRDQFKSIVQSSNESRYGTVTSSTESRDGIVQSSMKSRPGIIDKDSRHTSAESVRGTVKMPVRSTTQGNNTPNCMVSVESNHPSGSTQSGMDYSEMQLVIKNLDKCLEAAELTEYFKKEKYTRISVRNAATLLSMMRSVIPTNFSAGHSNISCWKSEFDLHLCSREFSGVIRDLSFEGHINNLTFHTSHATVPYQLKQILRSYDNQLRSSMVCMPSVFVAGFPKCGSSFVYCLVRNLANLANNKYLMNHTNKEPHFWVPEGPYFHHKVSPRYIDIAKYVVNYYSTAQSVQLKQTNEFSLLIDGSPNLIFQWPRYSRRENLENYCLVPAVLPLILPNAKYIVTLRDPVTMLYSAYWFSNSFNCPSLQRDEQERGPQIFHDKVVQKIQLYKSCTLYRPVEACLMVIFPQIEKPTSYHTGKCSRVRLEVGFYYYYIRRWLAVIPRDRFLFVTMEEMSSNFTNVAHKISNFLGLKIDEKLYARIPPKSCKNAQRRYDYRHDTALQMRNDTKKLLYEFFDPFNQKLAGLLQDSKYRWRP